MVKKENFETNVPERQTILGIPLATSGQRMGNFLIDLSCYKCLEYFIRMILRSCGIWDKFGKDDTVMFGIGIIFFYYFLQELYWGRTIGKWLTQTIVLTEDGEKLTPKETLFRTICRFIPFDAISFLFGLEPVGWHDSFSKTRVVKNIKILELDNSN